MITFDHLTKAYSGHRILDDVSFSVTPGSITGFLGPNGAGKSTAMRILLGMARADAGTATVAGRAYPDWPNPGRLVGSLLDADSFHPGRTGAESLRLSCLTMGLPKSRVAQVAEQVGLRPAELRQRVGDYSLGMRQRLGLAQALLGSPWVLVLDEPTNGLDPQGQRWLSELLRDQADRGCAVLLSSHQLPDVERIADRIVMIAAGQIVADGSVEQLRQTHGDLTDLYFARTAGYDRAC